MNILQRDEKKPLSGSVTWSDQLVIPAGKAYRAPDLIPLITRENVVEQRPQLMTCCLGPAG